MHNIPSKVIQMTILLFIFALLFSCSKDSDLLLDSVLNDPEVSLDEKDRIADEVSEDSLVTRTFSFSPTNDAYVQGTEGHDQSIVRLQENFRTSYLMFDLSAVNGSITDAVLQFSIDSDEGDGSIAIHKGQAENWTEENLTIDNAPGTEMQLGSMNKAYKVGAPEKVALDASNLNAEITTLVLTHSSGNDLAFASKEHPGNKGPQLIITYQAPADSPLIEQHEEQEVTEESNQEQTSEENTSQEENNHTNNNTASTEDAYYVTVNGKTTNDGRSEANAWSIEHAFESAIAGDVVYIKAGDYGSKELVADNSGTAGKPIKFIGYRNTPGDITSTEGSTFKYGETLEPTKMPMLKGNSNVDGIGLKISENFVEVFNFQITDYQIGVLSKGKNAVLNNIITNNNGEQANNNSQTGRGFQIYGDNSKIENCFSLNSNAEGINIKGADNCMIKNTSVYSDNKVNMGGYYIAITSGGSNNIIDGCVLYRDPSGDNSLNPHQGHGFVLKDKATNNIIKNSETYNTGIEVNFSGVAYNTFENIKISGNFTKYNKQYTSSIRIINGAHHNTFRNIEVNDARYAIVFIDFDDGYSASDADRDENQGGNDNIFESIIVNKAKNILSFNSAEVGWAATSFNNVFNNCTFKNITSVPFVTLQTTSGTRFINSSFINIPSKILKELNGGKSNVLPIEFENCNFSNIGFTIPN